MADEQRQQQRREAVLQPFTVEFGDERNSNAFVVGCLSRLEVRGGWRRDNVPPMSLGQTMSQMPDVPGQQMTILPREGKAVLSDPLEDDKALLERITKVMAGGAVLRTEGGLKAAPKMEIPLVDEDQLKTLVLTLVRWVECGNAKVVKGRLPTVEELRASPGRELYDPANSNVHGHPRYVEDVPAWRQQLEMPGKV